MVPGGTRDGEDEGNWAGRLAWFREALYGCLRERRDALFELADAVLTAQQPRGLPYLSLEPVFRRGHGMVYQGLAAGRVDEEAVRDLLAAARPRDWPLVFAIDLTAYPRPEADTSPGRARHHAAGPHGGDIAVAGWGFQVLAQLSFAADSWTAPQDQVRVESGHGTREAAGQIRAHAARLRAAGEARAPLYVLDAGYGAAELTWRLGGELAAGQVRVLVRVRADRVLYRDPGPRPPGRRGPDRKHGDRLACKDPGTWGPPDQQLTVADRRYGQVTVTCWGGLHPKLERKPGRGSSAFAGLDGELPILKGTLIRVQVGRLPGGRKDPDPIWLWHAGPCPPDLDLCWRGYLHRYDIEHTIRFAKHNLGWTRAYPRTPGQAARWTWLILAVLTQLRLARDHARDQRLPWEKPAVPGRLTPGRVRRDFPRLLTITGTPARTAKKTKPGPGRPKGRTSTPAPRHPVKKAAPRTPKR
jgi:hypothetical protein